MKTLKETQTKKLNSSRHSQPVSCYFIQKGSTQMLKALMITLVTLVSGLGLASQPLSATAITAMEAQNQFLNDYNTNTVYGFAEPKDIAVIAAEAQNQFLDDYNTNTIHGFAEETDIATLAIESSNRFIDSYNINTVHGFAEPKDIAIIAAEAQAQFLNDYVTNSTHGFGVTPSFPEAEAEVRYMKVLLVNEDFVSCLNAIDSLPLDSCLAANTEHQFIDDYVTGQLR